MSLCKHQSLMRISASCLSASHWVLLLWVKGPSLNLELSASDIICLGRMWAGLSQTSTHGLFWYFSKKPSAYLILYCMGTACMLLRVNLFDYYKSDAFCCVFSLFKWGYYYLFSAFKRLFFVGGTCCSIYFLCRMKCSLHKCVKASCINLIFYRFAAKGCF